MVLYVRSVLVEAAVIVRRVFVVERFPIHSCFFTTGYMWYYISSAAACTSYISLEPTLQSLETLNEHVRELSYWSSKYIVVASTGKYAEAQTSCFIVFFLSLSLLFLLFPYKLLIPL